MANKIVYLDYFIHLTDPALVATLQGTRFRTGVFFTGDAGHPLMAPTEASAKWGAPIVVTTGGPAYVDPPKITSDYFQTENNYPRNVASFERDGGGWFGIGFLFGSPDTTFFWRGTFIYAGAETGDAPVPGATLVPMPQRRWIDGFELPHRGEAQPPGASDNGGLRVCRAASRSVQGLGYHVDAPSGTSSRTHTPTGTGLAATHTLWERFYMRVRRFGATEYQIWAQTGVNTHGIQLFLLPSGQLALKSKDNFANLVTLYTTSALAVHVWRKLDLIYQFHNGAVEATFKLFLDGVLTINLEADALGLAGIGLRAATNTSLSQLASTAADTLVSVDFDDWIGADPPDPTLNSKDFYAGSSVRLISAAGFAADHNVAWTGDWRLLRQRINTGAGTVTNLTSVTSGSRLAVTTDADFEVDNAPNSRGAAALLVDIMGRRAGVANGSLGYKLPGGADVMAAIVEAAANEHDTVYYMPSGKLDPFPLGGLELKYDKGAAIDLSNIHTLQAIAELIGIFGPEDQAPLPTITDASSPADQASGPAAGSADVVAGVKEGLVARGAPLTGPCGAFEIVKRVAWALRTRGCGLLSKPTGNNCQGYSTDIVAFKSGSGTTLLYDVLIDGGGANTPAWNARTPLAGTDRWRAPIDPGDAPGSSGDGVTDVATWSASEPGYSLGARVTWTTTPYGLREYAAILAHTTAQQPADTTTGVVNSTYWQDLGLTLGDGGFSPAVIARHPGLHNAPYPRSPWAFGATAPLSPVVVKTGSYVGTGTYIDLAFTAPVTFLWIRPVTGGVGPIVWFSPMMAGHSGNGSAITMPIVEALEDPAFAGAVGPGTAEQQYLIRIFGAETDRNAVGVVYSYVAFCDPGMRFSLGDATHVTTGTAAYVNPLVHPDFTPEALWMNPEGFAAGRLGYKGIGHTANAITRSLGVAEVADGVGFGLGTLTLRPGLFVAADAQVPYLAFRREDGSTATAEQKARVVQLATYVGDGSASRTIGLTPASGRRPMWAIIVPHNAVQPIYRDPTHTTTTSTQLPATANAATGITAGGIDSISVGSVLNANGIVYDVFVFPGCDGAAGNGGWSTACEVVPVPPAVPTGTGWPSPPADPEGPQAPWPGGDVPTPTGPGGDFEDQCVDASTVVINQALSRIGVSKRVLDIVNEASAEAATARLHYLDDVSEVLRAHPWPFATRYAYLVWVSGSEAVPVNGDWTYAYRAPDDMMFARRIVKPGGNKRGWDTEPVDFRLGSDDTGPLIYTDWIIDPDPLSADFTIELEYTIRVSCAASQGDSLFKTALIWRHAHSLAPILSKDEKKVAFCWAMYLQTLGTAETAAQQEKEEPPDGDADWLTGRE